VTNSPNVQFSRPTRMMYSSVPRYSSYPILLVNELDVEMLSIQSDASSYNLTRARTRSLYGTMRGSSDWFSLSPDHFFPCFIKLGR